MNLEFVWSSSREGLTVTAVDRDHPGPAATTTLGWEQLGEVMVNGFDNAAQQVSQHLPPDKWLQ